jgi:hypothetical protein
MYTFLKNITPWRESNPGSSVLQADAMTTIPRRHLLCNLLHKNLLHNIFFRISIAELAPKRDFNGQRSLQETEIGEQSGRQGIQVDESFFFLGGGGQSDPVYLSSSLALHYFRLFFSCPLLCQLGWPASPCTWIASDFSVAWQFSQRTRFLLLIKLHTLMQGVSPPNVTKIVLEKQPQCFKYKRIYLHRNRLEKKCLKILKIWQKGIIKMF